MELNINSHFCCALEGTPITVQYVECLCSKNEAMTFINKHLIIFSIIAYKVNRRIGFLEKSVFRKVSDK